MGGPAIGVNIDDLRLPVKQAIKRAARMGFDAVELRTVSGDLDPRNLSVSGRRHLSRAVRDFGLGVAALDCDFGARGLSDASRVDAVVQKTGQVLELARDLRVPVVVGSVGWLDADDGESRDQVLAALRAIGEQADRIGSIYALTTSMNRPETLGEIVRELACPSVRVCADPGAMVMVGCDPIAGTEAVADQVILSHARDALAGTPERGGRETTLGEGRVDLLEYLSILSAAGYGGPQIIRRSGSERPLADLAAAKEYLEAQVG